MDVIVWIGAVIMGLSLGLLGSGGSILTVPLLVFIAHEPEKLAIAESLLIVGAVAAVGAFTSFLKGQSDIKLALYFGLPSMLSAYLGAWLSQFVSGQVQLGIFSLVMLGASFFMFRPIKASAEGQIKQLNFNRLLSASLAVGCLAGLVGVGGGFLIVPALLYISGISIQMAIGTSLMIIVMQSAAGFYKHHQLFSDMALSINWSVVLTVGACAIVGVIAGGQLASKLPQLLIKRIFGGLLVVLAIFTFTTVLG